MKEQENPFGFDPEQDVVPEPIVIISGGFDPVQSGHTALFRAASKRGQVHILLNSDAWLSRKKGSSILPYTVRADVLNLMVHEVHQVDDRDDTVILGLRELRKKHPNTKMYFVDSNAKKGPQSSEIKAQAQFCKELRIEVLWGDGKITEEDK